MEIIRSHTVGAAFDEIASKYAEKDAIVFHDQRITYRLLRERANRFAKGLLRLGVRPDDKVAVWMPNNPEWVYAFLASAKIGAVFVSVNSRFKTHELEYVLSQSDSTTVVFQDRLDKTNYLEIFRQLCPELASCRPGALRSPKFPLLINVICRTDGVYPGVIPVGEAMEMGNANFRTSGSAKRRSRSPRTICCSPLDAPCKGAYDTVDGRGTEGHKKTSPGTLSKLRTGPLR